MTILCTILARLVFPSLHHGCQFFRPLPDLLCPLAVKHLPRGFLPVFGLYRGDGVFESTESGEPQVEHHIQDNVLPHGVETRNPLERARYLTSDRGNIVVEKHQCFVASYSRIIKIPADSYRELVSDVAVRLETQAFMSNEHFAETTHRAFTVPMMSVRTR